MRQRGFTIIELLFASAATGVVILAASAFMLKSLSWYDELAAKVEMGVFNAIVALAIACFKAVVVILFFMHVKYQSKLIKITVAAGFFTFVVLTTMSLTDYMSRAWGLW